MASAVQTAVRSGFVAPLVDVEWRDSGNGEDFTLTGYAAVFESWSEELWTWAGTFREKIARGAFADVLAREPDVRLLFNHDENFPLARTRARTLELSEDERGLRVWARVAPTSYARDLRLAMQRGDVDQMSFAFTVAEDSWHENHETEEIERVILRVGDLYDVSVVTFPAYPDTAAAMRELRAAASAGKLHLRTVIPFRETPKADEDAPWDGAAEVARADVDDLRAMCVWYDANNPDAKESYKLPHHRASEAHPVVWRGVRAAMGRLMQADIPDSDRRGAYEHLARHYEQFDREPPAFEDLERAAALSCEVREEDFEGGAALRARLDLVARAERDPAGHATPRIAGGGNEPDPRLAALRARGRRARLHFDLKECS
jgi:hypothetical protein